MKILRATLFPDLAVTCASNDFQAIPHLCGAYDDVFGNIMALADSDTLFEIATGFRGPFTQVHRDQWHPDWYLHP